jgi:5,6-dimethylbenzimidazole synthase
MAGNNETYDMLLKLVKTRMSVRKFRSDPIPDETVDKILEVARWAMSGANSQPWEFIVVTDPDTKKQLRDAYSEHNTDFIFWMEQSGNTNCATLRIR